MHYPLTPSQIHDRLRRESIVFIEIPDDATGSPNHSHSYYAECNHIFSLGAFRKKTDSQITDSNM